MSFYSSSAAPNPSSVAPDPAIIVAGQGAGTAEQGSTLGATANSLKSLEATAAVGEGVSPLPLE